MPQATNKRRRGRPPKNPIPWLDEGVPSYVAEIDVDNDDLCAGVPELLKEERAFNAGEASRRAYVQRGNRAIHERVRKAERYRERLLNEYRSIVVGNHSTARAAELIHGKEKTTGRRQCSLRTVRRHIARIRKEVGHTP
jgi:hypothetical protein